MAMKVSLFSTGFSNWPIERTFAAAAANGYDGVDIGGGTVDETTLKKNLKKVLGIEGAPTPTPCEFTSDGIDIAVDAPVDGKAKLTVIPPADSDGAFFMRVNVKVK